MKTVKHIHADKIADAVGIAYTDHGNVDGAVMIAVEDKDHVRLLEAIIPDDQKWHMSHVVDRQSGYNQMKKTKDDSKNDKKLFSDFSCVDRISSLGFSVTSHTY